MKSTKLLLPFFAALCLLAATACGSTGTPSSGGVLHEPPQSEAPAPVGEFAPASTAPDNGWQFVLPSTAGIVTGSGDNAYFTDTMVNGGERIMYLPLGSGEARPLCKKEGCAHTDDTCDAWLSAGMGVVYYNDTLYAFGASIEGAPEYIDTHSTQTGQRQSTLMQFEDSESYPYSMQLLQNGGDIYYTEFYQPAGASTGEGDICLLHISLDEGTVQPLAQLPIAFGRAIGAEGGEIYLVGSTPGGAGAVLSAGTQTGQVQTIAELPGGCVGAGYLAGTVYAVNFEEDTLYTVDIATGTVDETPADFTSLRQNNPYVLRQLGGYALIDTTVAGTTKDAQYALDLQTGEVRHITLENETSSQYSWRVAYQQGDTLLVHYDTAVSSYTSTGMQGEEVEIPYHLAQLCWISAGDFLASSAQYTPILRAVE